MPTSCAVFGCKSGYKNHPYKGSIYLFPSDEDERQSWIDALPNRDFKQRGDTGGAPPTSLTKFRAPPTSLIEILSASRLPPPASRLPYVSVASLKKKISDDLNIISMVYTSH